MRQKAVLACACECGKPAGDEKKTGICRFHEQRCKGMCYNVAARGVRAKTIVEGIANDTKLVVTAVSEHQAEGSTCVLKLDSVNETISKEDCKKLTSVVRRLERRTSLQSL